MKRKIAMVAGALVLAVVTVLAMTNVTVTVPMAEVKYTNLVRWASNQNTTVEALFMERLTRDVEDQWFSTMLELWPKATLAQQQAALEALRTPPAESP